MEANDFIKSNPEVKYVFDNLNREIDRLKLLASLLRRKEISTEFKRNITLLLNSQRGSMQLINETYLGLSPEDDACSCVIELN